MNAIANVGHILISHRSTVFALGVLAGLVFGALLDCVETYIAMLSLERMRKEDK